MSPHLEGQSEIIPKTERRLVCSNWKSYTKHCACICSMYVLCSIYCITYTVLSKHDYILLLLEQLRPIERPGDLLKIKWTTTVLIVRPGLFPNALSTSNDQLPLLCLLCSKMAICVHLDYQRVCFKNPDDVQ